MSNYNSAEEQSKSSMTLRDADELHALIDTVPDAMVIADEHGLIASFSKGAEAMFGYAETEVIGQNVSILMTSPHRENHNAYMQRYLKTGEARIMGIGQVTTARHRDGSSFPISLAIGELKASGAPSFVAYIRDLSESRKTERELHTLQGALAHVSRISAMGSLATSLAHELNQPLTAVTNYAHSARDLLSQPSPDNIELVRGALEECASEALRAGRIVHRLRDFIKRGESERQIVSLSRIIQEASALSLMNGDGKGVDFETQIDTGADKVLVDPVQIQQVVLNLIRNALEAMIGSRHKQLRVNTHKTAKGFAQVSVLDSGPGLDEEVAERLFHPFNSTKSAGMGVGLSICHTIVQAHDGKIWVEPSDLGGCAFHFTVPIAERADEQQ